MKLTSLLVVAACFQVGARGFSQTVTFSGRNVPLQKVFSVVREQTGYSVFYDYDILSGAKPISLSVKDLSLPDFLRLALSGEGLGFSILKKTIFIKKLPAAAAPVEGLAAPASPPFIIRGTVINTDGKPLSGASVTNKKTRVSVATGTQGLFSMMVSEGDIVVVSYVSFGTVEIRAISASTAVVAYSSRLSGTDDAGERNVSALRTGQPLSAGTYGFIIALAPSEATLNEVVINKGYYTEKQKYSVGSVTKVTTKDIGKQPVSNILSALEGIVPGLDVSNTSGTPGASVQIRLRGINTMNDANATIAALVLVDGVPVTDLSYLSTSDVESVEVLKDATATAIYGSRGAAGVILITTKKGLRGHRGKLFFQAYTGLSKPVNTAKMLNTEQYRALRKEAFANDGVTITPSNAPDLYLDSSGSTDWSKAVYKNALSQDYQMSFSGGSQDVSYYVSGGYRNEDAIVQGDWYQKRFNFRMGLDARVSPRLSVGGGVGYTNNNSNLYNAVIAANIYYALPMIPAVNAGGADNTTAYVSPIINPYRTLSSFTNTQNNQFIGNAYVNYQLYKQLYFRTDLSYQLVSGQSTTFTPTTGAPYSTVSLAFYPNGTYTFTNNNAFTVEPQLNYSITAGKHSIKLLAGSTLIDRMSRYTTLSMTGYSSNLLTTLASASVYSNRTYSETPYKFASAFGRASYVYDDRYIVDGVFRRDGSSRFGANYHYGNFWAAGAGWIFSSEPFVQKLTGSNFYGKIKVSYGIAGNDNIGDFAYLNYSNTGVYNGTAATYLSGLANPYLRWEQTKKADFGLDLSFLSGRFTLSADYFFHRTEGTLYSQALSVVTGFSAISANLDGAVRNRGLELSLGGDLLRLKDFKWNSRFNISFLQNKLLSLPGLSLLGVVSRYQYQVGKPLALNWGIKYLGVDPATGLAKYEDVDHSGTIATYTPDMQVLGKTIPDFYGSWTNSFSWRRWELYVLTQWVSGVQKPYNTWTSGIGEQYNLPVSALGRWQKPGQVTDIPRAAAPGSAAAINNDKISQSSLAYSDASFIRVKNITLSYVIPSIGQKVISNMRIFVTAYNVFTSTDYKGNDPENGATFVPVTKMYSAGLSFNL
ncbi:MAG TPA: SusC/RagA family TonB-linked outer membrane protein [Puia sp.]|jgi:TonB-linked SusC/RagA family outer membrane protein